MQKSNLLEILSTIQVAIKQATGKDIDINFNSALVNTSKTMIMYDKAKRYLNDNNVIVTRYAEK